MKIIIQEKELGNIESSLSYFLKFNLPKDVKILDIGCNYGSLIYNLHKKGYKNVYGIDINKENIANGKSAYPSIRKRLSVYNGKKIPFNEESFDVVLMFDVIEHIPNVQDFLKNEVYRVLKNGGLFVFQTPNKYVNIPWEIVNQKSLTKWKKYHISLQSYSSLTRILLNSGFDKIRIEKHEVMTKHNKDKLSKKIGFAGLALLYSLQKMPLVLYPNFWGSGRR